MFKPTPNDEETTPGPQSKRLKIANEASCSLDSNDKPSATASPKGESGDVADENVPKPMLSYTNPRIITVSSLSSPLRAIELLPQQKVSHLSSSPLARKDLPFKTQIPSPVRSVKDDLDNDHVSVCSSLDLDTPHDDPVPLVENNPQIVRSMDGNDPFDDHEVIDHGNVECSVIDTNERHESPSIVQHTCKTPLSIQSYPVRVTSNVSNKNDVNAMKAESVSDSNFALYSKFSSYSIFMENWEKYCRYNFYVFRRYSSVLHKPEQVKDLNLFPYKYVVFICTHGGPIRQRGTGLRKNQAYFPDHCPFRVRIMYDSDINQYVVSVSDLRHTCQPSEANYIQHPQKRRLNEAERNRFIVDGRVHLDAPVHKVVKEIRRSTKKPVNNQDVKNWTNKYKGRNGKVDDLKELENFYLKQVSEKGAFFEILDDEEGNISSIFYQSAAMKERLEQFPSVIHLDATYNVASCGYPLMCYLIVDGNGTSKMVGYAFLEKETAAVHANALKALVKHTKPEIVAKIKFAILDKSMAEISAIHSIPELRHVRFVLCRFHAIKAVKEHFTKSGLNSTFKKDLVKLFCCMVYEPSEEKYIEALNAINTFCDDHKEQNPDLAAIPNYINNHWHAIKDTFALHCLKSERIFSSYTNNRSENFNAQIKRRIRLQTFLVNIAQVLDEIDTEQYMKMQEDKWERENKTFLPQDMDRNATILNSIACTLVSSEKVKVLLAQYEYSKDIDISTCNADKGQLSCPRINGSCIFNASDGLPCKHLFKVRVHNKEIILEKGMITNHWLLKEKPPLKKTHIKNARERHNQVNPTCTNLKDHLMAEPESVRVRKLSILQNVMDVWSGHDFENGTPKSNFEKLPRRHLKTSGNIRHFKPKKKPTQNRDNNSDLMVGYSTPFENAFNASYGLLGARQPFLKEDFAILKDKTEFISSIHLEYISLLLKSKFPDIAGLEPTTTFEESRFTPINGKVFMQFLYTGYSHWVLVTNIGLTEDERQNTVLLYDSLLSFQENSNESIDIMPPITWQVRQLLSEPGSNLDYHIKVMHCHQQKDSYSCGDRAIAASVCLVNNTRPEDIVLLPNLRSHVFEILKKQEILPFPHTKYSDQNKSTHYVNAGLGFVRPIEFLGDTQHYKSLCYCGFPESYYDMMTCSVCNLDFHQCCSLVESKLSTTLQGFKCFPCLFPATNETLVSPEAIEEMETFVANNHDTVKSLVSTIKVTRKMRDLVYTTAQYETIVQSLNIHDAASFIIRKGDLYTTVESIYIMAKVPLKERPLYRLNQAELILLLVKLIGHFKGTNVFPLFCPSEIIEIATNDAEAKLLLAAHQPSLRIVRDSLNKALANMKKFELEGKTFLKCKPKFNDFKNIMANANKHVLEFKKLSFQGQFSKPILKRLQVTRQIAEDIDHTLSEYKVVFDGIVASLKLIF